MGIGEEDMQNRWLEKAVGILARPGQFVLDRIGYRYAGSIDRYVDSCMGTQQSQDDVRREVVGAWLTLVVVGMTVGTALVLFGLEIEAIYVILLSTCLPIVVLRHFKNKREAIRKQITEEMPQVLNLLVILLDTGIPLSVALRSVASEEYGNGELRKILHRSVEAIDSGVPTTVVWRRFSNECMTADGAVLGSLIVRETTIGTHKVGDSLRALCISAEQASRRETIRAGEVAKAKLLIPQTLIFAGIVLLVGYPALAVLGGV